MLALPFDAVVGCVAVVHVEFPSHAMSGGTGERPAEHSSEADAPDRKVRLVLPLAREVAGDRSNGQRSASRNDPEQTTLRLRQNPSHGAISLVGLKKCRGAGERANVEGRNDYKIAPQRAYYPQPIVPVRYYDRGSA